MNEHALFADYPLTDEQTFTWVWVVCPSCGAANSAIEPEVILTVCGSCGEDMSPENAA